MTTVCAVARDGKVVMGADTMTNVYDRPVHGFAKVRRVVFTHGGGEALLGFSGSGALPDLLNAHLTIAAEPKDGAADEQRWATAVAAAITDIAVEARLTDEGQMDSRILLGWGGRLWTIGHHMAIHHDDGIAAIGSGEGPAIGAIDYALQAGDTNLHTIVTRAVCIGINRDRYSGGTVTIETLG